MTMLASVMRCLVHDMVRIPEELTVRARLSGLEERRSSRCWRATSDRERRSSTACVLSRSRSNDPRGDADAGARLSTRTLPPRCLAVRGGAGLGRRRDKRRSTRLMTEKVRKRPSSLRAAGVIMPN